MSYSHLIPVLPVLFKDSDGWLISGNGAVITGTVAADTIAFTIGNTLVNAFAGANTITGTSGHKKILTGSGVDTIALTSGNNWIDAGGGANTITATSGNNIIYSGIGADTITLTSGNNWIDAGGGANTITVTGGINFIHTGDGVDTITAGDGGNTIHAGNGANTVTTGAGNDTVTGGNGVDTITTGAGDDEVYAASGANTVTTGAGNDIVFTGVNVDTVALGAGDDTVHIMGGTDTIAGGAGNDTLVANFAAALGSITVNGLAGTEASGYAGNISGLGIATFAGIENFDIISGRFNDVIQTGGGDDTVNAGNGNNTVTLGGGTDEAIYNMTANTGTSNVYKGGSGFDTLTLNLTTTEWFRADVQGDIAEYLAFQAAHTDMETDEVDSDMFQFSAFDLIAAEFEALNIVVDGVVLDPTDGADDDFVKLKEDDTAKSFHSVLINDDAGPLAYSVTLISGPPKGVLNFNVGSRGAPDGTYSFNPNGDFEDLADGETRNVSFVYEMQDAFHGPIEATATITVMGENDSPLADAARATLGEDDISVLINVSGSDVDASDRLTFKILDAPTDVNGNQYGSVQNNNDGTFTFLTGDNFQFLDAGETRGMTFNYVAIDDSQTATNTSVAQTVTVAVTGADDSRLSSTPLPGSDTFLLSTADQSIFGTGDASIENPTLPFLGGSWDESFSVELVPGASKSIGSIDLGILGEISGITVSSPSLSLAGSSSGTIGLQPFFVMTGGDIDATIPIGASFDVPRQVEAGETFKLGSNFQFGNDTNISTQSAEIEFGVDLVLELAAQMSIDYSSSSLGGGGSFNIIPSFDINQNFNIFTINSGDAAGDIPLSLAFQKFPAIDDFLTLSVAVPNVTTTGGFSEYGLGYDVVPITSSGEDQIASLSVDVDAIISEGLSTLSGGAALTVPLGFEGGYALAFDAGPFGNINLASFNIKADLLKSDLSTDISLLQGFSLELKDLPLMMILEDGSEITGLSLGDDITVTAPIGFDADVDGDADGLIKFNIDVDMDAVLTTMVSLGFDTTFTLGALRAIGSVSSFLFDTLNFNAFEGGGAGTDDDFLYYESASLVNEKVVVFEDTFALLGFDMSSTNTTTEYFDVA